MAKDIDLFKSILQNTFTSLYNNLTLTLYIGFISLIGFLLGLAISIPAMFLSTFVGLSFIGYFVATTNIYYSYQFYNNDAITYDFNLYQDATKLYGRKMAYSYMFVGFFVVAAIISSAVMGLVLQNTLPNLAITVGLITFCLQLVIIWFVTQYTGYFVATQRISGIEPIIKSYAMTRNNGIESLGLFIFRVVFIGSIVSIGVLFGTVLLPALISIGLEPILSEYVLSIVNIFFAILFFIGVVLASMFAICGYYYFGAIYFCKKQNYPLRSFIEE